MSNSKYPRSDEGSHYGPRGGADGSRDYDGDRKRPGYGNNQQGRGGNNFGGGYYGGGREGGGGRGSGREQYGGRGGGGGGRGGRGGGQSHGDLLDLMSRYSGFLDDAACLKVISPPHHERDRSAHFESKQSMSMPSLSAWRNADPVGLQLDKVHSAPIIRSNFF